MQEVNVQSGADAESAIEEAIAAVMESAEHYQTGILVTRISQDTYIVRAHPTVPYGLVRQQPMSLDSRVTTWRSPATRLLPPD